jgi:flagellar biosynthesis/type III secretory pathway protein FliH
MKKYYTAILILTLASCTARVNTGQSPVSDSISEQTDTFVITADTVQKPQNASESSSSLSEEDYFTSEQEAYDEGYINGEQEGYTDAIHHLEYGYFYDDEPTYPGFPEAYMDGYEDGYHDGFVEGLEWN